MSTFDEILKEKLQTQVPVKGKEGVKIDPMEAMVNALMANAMKGDIASISFIRNMTNTTDPIKEIEAQQAYTLYVAQVADRLKHQLMEEKAWDGQQTEVEMLADTAIMVEKLSRATAKPDFQAVITDPRTGKQTVSPLIALRDNQRELFDKQLAKLRREAINRMMVRKNMKL